MRYAKKMTAAVLAGCTMFVFSNAALAAPADGAGAPPSRVECFERGVPDGPAGFAKDRGLIRDYQQQFESDYGWMYADTRRDAARSFAQVDNALDDNKISQQQAEKLKKKLISFYKDKQKYEDNMRKLDKREARSYHEQHRHHLSLRDNIPELAKSSGIAESTLDSILRPERRHPHFRGHQQMYDGLQQLRQKLISEGKITQQEVDAMSSYMQSLHNKYVQMDADQKDGFMQDFRKMSDEEKLSDMSAGTGISAERLKEIFDAFKDEIRQDLNG